MSSGILEQFRRRSEEIETIEKAVSLILEDKSKNKQKMNSVLYDRAICYLIDRASVLASKNVEYVDSADSLRKEELLFLAGKNNIGSNDLWSNFYFRINQARSAGRQSSEVDISNVAPVDLAGEAYTAVRTKLSVFSSGELGGRIVDLSEFYNKFINIEKVRMIKGFEIDYTTWLKSFDQILSSIPRHIKYMDKPWQDYVESLGNYLESFFIKLNPLANSNKAKETFLEEFNSKWLSNSICHWKIRTQKMDFYALETDTICSTEAGFERHVESKKFKAVKSKLTDGNDLEKLRRESEEKDKKLAWKEYIVERFKELLEKTIQETVDEIQRKQSQTSAELAANSVFHSRSHEQNDDVNEEDEVINTEGIDEEVDEDQKPIYNPLNLPLGFDGKPIPFWLWKLNGLSHEFKCEICGDYSYWGAQNFHKHFNEWRHVQAMKDLNIPNLPQFRDVTKIADALDLWKKIQKKKKDSIFDSIEEEFEDKAGNVMTGELLADLRRQGLA